MKQLIAGIALLGFAIFITSCTGSAVCSINKKGFLNGFDALVTSAEKKDMKSNDPTWENYDKKFKQIVEECYPSYEEDMTLEEKKEFASKSVEYYWHRHGLGFVKRLGDKDDPLAQEIVEQSREAWGSLDAVISELLDELGVTLKDFDTKEFENLFKEMGTDMEKWGKKIEKIFQKK